MRHPSLRATLAGSAAAVVVLVAAALRLSTPRCDDGPCLTAEALLAYEPPEPPRILDRHGELVGHLAGERRIVVDLDRIPELVREGFVAVEDRRFRRHPGVDLRAVVRAAAANVTAGAVEQGASTLTMQLVRNVFDVAGYGRWRRKLVELRMALAVEETLSKPQILGLYLNQIYLGGGVYGVEAAARSYFGRSVDALSTAEAALLIGLARNPEGYNPRRNPERARARRGVVLDVLVREGLIDAAEAEAARDAPLDVAPQPDRGLGAYYLAAVDRKLRELFPDPRSRHGSRVHTGYDATLQVAAEAELRDQIAAIESGRYGPYRHPTPPGDTLPRAEGASPYLQGMVVALDPASGAVRAVVGGRDFRHSEFDRALQARRQPGSAFKPLVWAAALERGVVLAQRVETTPIAYRLASGETWTPRDDQSDGRPLTVRQALVQSSNAAAARVGDLAGAERVAALAKRLGITGDVPAFPSIFLGSAEVVPVELVAAYAAIANGGRRVTPHLITRVEDRDGRILWTPDDRVAPALDQGVAYLTLSALRDVVDRGTGWSVRQSGYAGVAAGKTGTTDGGRDVWFVGMTPDVVAGVWLGFDRPREILPGASGGLLAAPVWGRVAPSASADDGPAEGWSRPENVTSVRIDVETGLLATSRCPPENVQEELFLLGTAPSEACRTHRPGFFDRLWRGIARILP